MGLQFRRGTAADVTSENFIPAIGEPVYLTDDQDLYVGDGSTVGGNKIGGASKLEDLTNIRLTPEDVNTIQSYSVTSNTVTINTATNNPYAVNDRITISDAAVIALNGTHTIVSKPAANQFLFELTLADVSNTVTTGTTTPVIDDKEILSFDSANSRFTNQKPTDVIGLLSNHTDVDTYDSTSAAAINNSLGKVLRYDTDNNWSVKRPGESIRLTSGQHFFGNDFSVGTTGNIYTGNTADWTENTGNTNTNLHSASPGSIPPPPYGDAAYDSASHRYAPVAAYEDSTDFTLDFWLYRDSSGGSLYEYGMNFYSNLSSSFQFFYPEYSTSVLRLKSGMLADGTGPVSFASTVVQWSVGSLSDQWVHVCIVRKGSDFRAWWNGADQGAGTLQGSYTADHNFKFSNAGNFYSIQYENDGHLIGPHYFDLKKAHRDPAGGDIFVPTERVDFYNKKSGVNVGELVDVTNNAFVDGDVLTYHKGLWTVNKALYGKLYYSQATAPTGTVLSSDRIGNWTGLTGEWRDMTYANKTNNNSQGPNIDSEDPTLLLEDQVSPINQISGLPEGIVRIDVEADFVLNNLSANSYNAHYLELKWQDGLTDVDSRTQFVFPAHTATSTAITITQKASVIAYSRAYDSGYIECKIDQEQDADFYISRAILSVTKIG